MGKTGPKKEKLRRIPRWGWGLLIAAVLALLMGLVLPYFLKVDRYRTLVTAAIESRTGRKVTIGKLRVRLLPRVGFVVEDFRLGNPPAFAPGDLLRVEAIRGNLALGPLLHRQIQLSSIELIRPKLTLLEDDGGRTNYSFPEDSGRNPTPRSATRDPKFEQPPQEVAGTSFRFAEVNQIELTDAELAVARVPPGRRDAQAPIHSLLVRRINARLNHVRFEPLEPERWEGTAQLEGVLLELAGWKEPFEFRAGRVTLRAGRVESEFRLRVGGAAEVQGRLQVPNLERAVPTFDLTTSQLGLDQLLALQAAAPPRPRTSAPRGSELVAQGRLAAERVRWQQFAAQNATAEIRIFADRTEVWPVTMALYGGTLQISARTDRTQTPARFSSNVQVRNADVGKMLSVAAPTLRGKIGGTGELDLQIFGSLGADWKRSLTGTGRFVVRDGRLPGLDLRGFPGLLAKAEGLGGEIPFRVIQGDLSIVGGRLLSRRVHMDSPRGTADLRGSLGLDGSLDYDGQVVLIPGAAAATEMRSPAGVLSGIIGGVLQRNVERVTVPIAIRGTIEEPKVTPGRGLPTITPPAPTTPPPKKSILDFFRPSQR